MNNPRQDGESLEDCSKRVLIEVLQNSAAEPQPEPKPDFVWTDEFDEQPVEMSQLLRSMLNANNREKAKEFVNSWFRMANSGNRTAMRELLERIEGPAYYFEEAEWPSAKRKTPGYRPP